MNKLILFSLCMILSSVSLAREQIKVVGSSAIRHAPGLSLKFGLAPEDQTAGIPAQKALFIDADGLSPIVSFKEDIEKYKEIKHLLRVDGRKAPTPLDSECIFQNTRRFPHHLPFIQQVAWTGQWGGRWWASTPSGRLLMP